ncbi:hypothetical protein PENSOL_c264G00313, partial [Penicillium solitum]
VKSARLIAALAATETTPRGPNAPPRGEQISLGIPERPLTVISGAF